MPPTDPRWLALTPEDIETEYLAHQYAEHGIPDEVEDENFDENLAELEAQMTGNPAASAADAPIVVDLGGDDFEEVINDKRN